MSDEQQDREADGGGRRGLPGRGSVKERTLAVLVRLAAKAPVHQLARRHTMRAENIEGWCDDATGVNADARSQGPGRAPRAIELEREDRELKATVTDLSIDKARQLQPVARHPTEPARSC